MLCWRAGHLVHVMDHCEPDEAISEAEPVLQAPQKLLRVGILLLAEIAWMASKKAGNLMLQRSRLVDVVSALGARAWLQAGQ